MSNIRTVVWENFQPNFYVLAPRQLLESQPQTWLMSAFIDQHQKVVLKPLLQRFPTVTLLDISEIMSRFAISMILFPGKYANDYDGLRGLINRRILPGLI